MSPEVHGRGPSPRHLHGRNFDTATHNRLARATKLALAGVLFIAALAILQQLASMPTHDALGSDNHHMLSLRMVHRIIVVDIRGALAFVDHDGSPETMLSLHPMPIALLSRMLAFSPILVCPVSPGTSCIEILRYPPTPGLSEKVLVELLLLPVVLVDRKLLELIRERSSHNVFSIPLQESSLTPTALP
jgi:hypothetical protein